MESLALPCLPPVPVRYRLAPLAARQLPRGAGTVSARRWIHRRAGHGLVRRDNQDALCWQDRMSESWGGMLTPEHLKIAEDYLAATESNLAAKPRTIGQRTSGYCTRRWRRPKENRLQRRKILKRHTHGGQSGKDLRAVWIWLENFGTEMELFYPQTRPLSGALNGGIFDVCTQCGDQFRA